LYLYFTLHSLDLTYPIVAAIIGYFTVSYFSPAYFKLVAKIVFSIAASALLIYTIILPELPSILSHSIITSALAGPSNRVILHPAYGYLIITYFPIFACGILIPSLIIFIGVVAVEGVFLRKTEIRALSPCTKSKDIEMLQNIDPLASQYICLVNEQGRPITHLEHRALLRSLIRPSRNASTSA